MINNRPLTTVSTDPNEIAPLSPSQLIYGLSNEGPLPELSEFIQETESSSPAIILSQRWKHQQSLVSAFWKRFNKEYLAYPRTAHWVINQSLADY